MTWPYKACKSLLLVSVIIVPNKKGLLNHKVNNLKENQMQYFEYKSSWKAMFKQNKKEIIFIVATSHIIKKKKLLQDVYRRKFSNIDHHEHLRVPFEQTLWITDYGLASSKFSQLIWKSIVKTLNSHLRSMFRILWCRTTPLKTQDVKTLPLMHMVLIKYRNIDYCSTTPILLRKQEMLGQLGVGKHSNIMIYAEKVCVILV